MECGYKYFMLAFLSVLFITGCSNESQPATDNQHESEGITIPAIKLPKNTANLDMIGLIVYDGGIYTQTNTHIDSSMAEELIDDRLGMTKGNIDEWSSQVAYSEELASTIPPMDVYSVKGYDEDFRIMAYQDTENEPYAEFFERLNGITIQSGEDLFGNLQIAGNVSSAKWRSYENWNHEVKDFHPLTDMSTLDTFLNELNETRPVLRNVESEPMNTSRDDEHFRELTLSLDDGSEVALKLFKEGFIYYGTMDVYFEMGEEAFSEFWKILQ